MVEKVGGLNPTMALTAGEQVMVTIRNEDKGMLHDFSIPEWGVEPAAWSGATERSITFRVPATASTPSYICTPHSAMMSGRILVSNEVAAPVLFSRQQAAVRPPAVRDHCRPLRSDHGPAVLRPRSPLEAKLVATIDWSSRQRVLDLACGTGDIAFALAAKGAAVVGLDITHPHA